MKRRGVFCLAGLMALALLLGSLPAPVQAAPPPGWPLGGTVVVKGVSLPFRYVSDTPGVRVYYQVLVPTRTLGLLPITIGVPWSTPPALVGPYLQTRANQILGPLPIPLPY
jgi:hypothetical protein